MQPYLDHEGIQYNPRTLYLVRILIETACRLQEFLAANVSPALQSIMGTENICIGWSDASSNNTEMHFHNNIPAQGGGGEMSFSINCSGKVAYNDVMSFMIYILSHTQDILLNSIASIGQKTHLKSHNAQGEEVACEVQHFFQDDAKLKIHFKQLAALWESATDETKSLAINTMTKLLGFQKYDTGQGYGTYSKNVECQEQALNPIYYVVSALAGLIIGYYGYQGYQHYQNYKKHKNQVTPIQTKPNPNNETERPLNDDTKKKDLDIEMNQLQEEDSSDPKKSLQQSIKVEQEEYAEIYRNNLPNKVQCKSIQERIIDKMSGQNEQGNNNIRSSNF